MDLVLFVIPGLGMSGGVAVADADLRLQRIITPGRVPVSVPLLLGVLD